MREASLRLTVCLGLVLLVGTSSVSAAYDTLVGYDRLAAELGSATPDGTGIAVQHVEGLVTNGGYMPNTGNAELSGKTITNVSGTSSALSWHADRVAWNFYGNTHSIASGISQINGYDASNWMASGFLNHGKTTAPQVVNDRLANHSWVAGNSSSDRSILSRIDYVVETDDFLQVAGLDNSRRGYTVLADAFNAITVGVTSGVHDSGTYAVDALYVANRTRPTLVAPGNYSGDPNAIDTKTSYAAPQVAAATAVLLETAANPALSNGSYLGPRTGRTVHHAETTEAIKAALMAGADRAVDNAFGPDLSDYAVDTANGLSRAYGAGQLNVYNSYRIIAAGEQDSAEDGNPADIGRFGFDYDPAFGGANASNATASYEFTAGAGHHTLIASLVWNLDVVGGDTGFSTNATLYNLDLLLYDLDASGTEPIVASSSLIDNTENLFFELTTGHRYSMQVAPGIDQGTFEWDYALAWQVTPEPASLVLLVLGTFGLLRRRR